MLTRSQLSHIRDYIICQKYQAERLAREANSANNIDGRAQAAIVKEQTRRAKELKRLEIALAAEIDTLPEGGETICPEVTANPHPRDTDPRAKRKSSATGKKSKGRAVGTPGAKRSAKNANDSTKRKPCRPRKTAPTE